MLRGQRGPNQAGARLCLGHGKKPRDHKTKALWARFGAVSGLEMNAEQGGDRVLVVSQTRA